MNDPHVDALIYRVEHGDDVNYDAAPPMKYENEVFTVRIERGDDKSKKGLVRFEFKTHFATVEEAQAAVEPFIWSWELSANLDHYSHQFNLSFDDSKISDRNPNLNGTMEIAAGVKVSVSMHGVVHRGHFPEVPLALAVNTDVEFMYLRYKRYQEGGEPLPSMAYFCLTVLEIGAGGRRKAAKNYSISKDVLAEIGRLSSTRGGTEARKVGASDIEKKLTEAECRRLIAAVRHLIRRAAEIAYNPGKVYPRITMADL
jgi:hypothetical protein